MQSHNSSFTTRTISGNFRLPSTETTQPEDNDAKERFSHFISEICSAIQFHGVGQALLEKEAWLRASFHSIIMPKINSKGETNARILISNLLTLYADHLEDTIPSLASTILDNLDKQSRKDKHAPLSVLLTSTQREHQAYVKTRLREAFAPEKLITSLPCVQHAIERLNHYQTPTDAQLAFLKLKDQYYIHLQTDRKSTQFRNSTWQFTAYSLTEMLNLQEQENAPTEIYKIIKANSFIYRKIDHFFQSYGNLTHFDTLEKDLKCLLEKEIVHQVSNKYQQLNSEPTTPSKRRGSLVPHLSLSSLSAASPYKIPSSTRNSPSSSNRNSPNSSSPNSNQSTTPTLSFSSSNSFNLSSPNGSMNSTNSFTSSTGSQLPIQPLSPLSRSRKDTMSLGEISPAPSPRSRSSSTSTHDDTLDYLSPRPAIPLIRSTSTEFITPICALMVNFIEENLGKKINLESASAAIKHVLGNSKLSRRTGLSGTNLESLNRDTLSHHKRLQQTFMAIGNIADAEGNIDISKIEKSIKASKEGCTVC